MKTTQKIGYEIISLFTSIERIPLNIYSTHNIIGILYCITNTRELWQQYNPSQNSIIKRLVSCSINHADITRQLNQGSKNPVHIANIHIPIFVLLIW